MSQVEVLIAVPFGEDFIERIRAVDVRLCVREAPPELLRWLRDDLRTDPETLATAQAQAVEYLEGTDVLVGWVRLTPPLLARMPKLRWVQLVGAGVDSMPLEHYRGLLLTNASGVAATPMAEYVLGMMLTFVKGFPLLMRRQRERDWDHAFEPRELAGKTCGIVGMGAIGGETARLARALGMRVLGIRRSVTARGTSDTAHELLPLSDLPYLLRESDFVVLATPLTAETRHLIGARELALMKPSAVLINVGRGAVVDEPALIAALRDGRIAGAGLDVVEREPLAADSPLWDMENVFITPHVSAGGEGYADRAADIVCENLRRYLAGEQMINVVDIDLGY